MEGGVDDEVGGDGDRLSSLPENIIRYILSFLGSVDIVRASAVSRKWRYIWVSMPYLCVDIPYRMKFNDFVGWTGCFRWTNHNSPWKIPNRTSSCLKYHLKIVELFQVGDDKYEIDLVRFFLENGHVLQKMRISWVFRSPLFSNPVYSNGNTDEFISEVMKFPRSSPNIALTFIEPEKLDRML
ncbi:hypothetical protein Q3G72_018730 [Acer saccharum]|nr:hypothetical protein Q3G72_018730 [Acer saccharum]